MTVASSACKATHPSAGKNRQLGGNALASEPDAEPEIEFGDVQARPSLQRLRPDRDGQFAVVAIGTPGSTDLPIFVDLDVMRDMEAHALTNTDVELGGVLLGWQAKDETGRPFVQIVDSLRAEHYEATRPLRNGSLYLRSFFRWIRGRRLGDRPAAANPRLVSMDSAGHYRTAPWLVPHCPPPSPTGAGLLFSTLFRCADASF
ncbi:MAG: hypothetical protein LW697_05355 [Blastopirellula sp.]|nr:hypothetical protein [Blastopirellula sp.]